MRALKRALVLSAVGFCAIGLSTLRYVFPSGGRIHITNQVNDYRVEDGRSITEGASINWNQRFNVRINDRSGVSLTHLFNVSERPRYKPNSRLGSSTPQGQFKVGTSTEGGKLKENGTTATNQQFHGSSEKSTSKRSSAVRKPLYFSKGLPEDKTTELVNTLNLSSDGGADKSINHEFNNRSNGSEVGKQVPVTKALKFRTNATKLPSIADLHRQLVCVTAISDNHFREAQEFFTTVQHCLPDKKIIVYDLGLNLNNRRQVSNYTNVELHAFPFDDYSHLPYVRVLKNYAWKPIVFKLVSQEYDVIMYGDASLRMRTCDINPALEHLLKFPLLNAHPIGYRAIEFTHDSMMTYLNYPKTRKEMAGVQTLEASGWLLWANDLMKEKLIEPWFDCALHKECIAPEGAVLWPCKFTSQHDGHFVGCHRYDQSAILLILAREFGLHFESKASDKSISDTLWTIKKSGITV